MHLLYGPPDEVLRVPWINYLLNYPLNGPTVKAFEFWFYFKPTAAGESPNIFENLNPGMVKFVLADLEGGGILTQVYSSEIGEKKHARVLHNSAQE